MTNLNLSDVFTVIDDQTQRFWSWLMLKDKFNLTKPNLLRIEDLKDIANDLNCRELGNDTVSGILTRCHSQIKMLIGYAENPDFLDYTRAEAAQFPSVCHFDDTLKSVFRYRWYNLSSKQLTSLKIKLRAFLILEGTLPAIPTDSFDYRHVCWDCRFERAVIFNDEEVHDDEDDDDLTANGCCHLLFFLTDADRVGQNQTISKKISLNDDELDFSNVDRVEWKLEIRRKERLRKTRQLVLLQIEREKMKSQKVIASIRCPKQVGIMCFDDFKLYENRLQKSCLTSRHFEQNEFIFYQENEIDDFQNRLKRSMCWDYDTRVIYERSLDKWSTLFLFLKGKNILSSDATLRGILSAERKDALSIQNWFDYLKTRPLLSVFDQKENDKSASVDLFDSLLFLTCIETFIDVVQFPVVSADQFEPDEKNDVIALYHNDDSESIRNEQKERHRGVANHLTFGVRRAGFRDLKCNDVVSLCLFWLRSTRKTYKNDILDYVSNRRVDR